MNTPPERYRHYLETLTETGLASIGNFVTEDVHFKDPFNDVRGVGEMRRVLQHMFDNIEGVRFEIHRCLNDENDCLIEWTFYGRLRKQPWQFDGTSALRFASDGRVSEHIDYWDSASAFYETLPLLGTIIRWLRRRISES